MLPSDAQSTLDVQVTLVHASYLEYKLTLGLQCTLAYIGYSEGI